MRKTLPDLKFERMLWKKKFVVLGVDEVGRGALAGPLVAAAVCFKPTLKKDEINALQDLGIDDSKRLTPKKRRVLSTLIKKHALWGFVSEVSAFKINEHGIARATQAAMRKAILKIKEKLDGQKLFVLVDGFHVRYLRGIGLANQKAIVHGDRIALSIAAASILAKVERDRKLRKLSRKFRPYAWGRNKGYGTRAHIEAIKKHGPTSLHRSLFLRKIFQSYTSEV